MVEWGGGMGWWDGMAGKRDDMVEWDGTNPSGRQVENNINKLRVQPAGRRDKLVARGGQSAWST